MIEFAGFFVSYYFGVKTGSIFTIYALQQGWKFGATLLKRWDGTQKKIKKKMSSNNEKTIDNQCHLREYRMKEGKQNRKEVKERKATVFNQKNIKNYVYLQLPL